MPNKIHFLTKYSKKGASSRYRTFQYIDYFNEHFSTSIQSLFDDDYINNRYNSKYINPFTIIKSYFKRLIYLFKIRKNDIVYIEYEIFPYFPPVFENILKLFNIKFVLDFDDAIFHNYDLNNSFIIRILLKNKIPNIIKKANIIITGSPYLTTYVKKYNEEVFEIPTSINFTKYDFSFQKRTSSDKFTIGWIGTRFTSKNIKLILGALNKFCTKYNVVVKLIGFDSSICPINNPSIHSVNWNNESEIDELLSLDLGVMPLFDQPFERGKCGFKLIQYMACGLPTISTPLESNLKINHNNGNLFATTEIEWYDAFQYVFHNKEYFKKVGELNRDIISKFYSIESNRIKYINIFNSI